jgi:uncharacterized protein (TIGR03437 family)
MPQVFTNSTGAARAANQGGSMNTSTNPAQPGSIVSIWMTGGGAAPASSDNTIDSALDSNPYPVSVLAANANQGSLGRYYEVQVGAAIAVFAINVAN